ncbi:tRNA (adenine(22)-N(1))-methyltransferase [Metabacillus malikii]|nr:tRNA (adenine(22)-N(1))-methyltransferase TrmK [Metabacillus malikii]
MNELKLSKRLEVVASYIPKDAIFADIGSDHAYLPCYSIINGIAKGAIAGEITEGPFLSAQRQVSKSNLDEVISVRKGDGLSVIKEDEKVDCITIAGMGGSLITKILEDGKLKLDYVKRLVLQPNIHAINIREWLINNEWELINEQIIEEDNKIYEILVAEKGNAHRPYHKHSLQSGLLFGPFLLEENNKVFQKKWTNERTHLQTILAQLQTAGYTFENSEKYREVSGQLNLIEEVIQA